MIDMAKLEKTGLEQGFSHVAHLDCSLLNPKEEVRDMCAANKCHAYGKYWTCPPGCGTLEECEEKMKNFKEGIIVQTVGELEDELDGEGMMEASDQHREHFIALERILRKDYPDMLAMGSGGCGKCETCTYPDAPCRFPKESFSSMEANGLVVSEVCQANNLAYYYGPCTIAYTSCFLLE